MKDKVYRASVPAYGHSKQWITTPVRTVSQESLTNVWIKFENRMHAVIRESGGNVEHIGSSTRVYLVGA